MDFIDLKAQLNRIRPQVEARLKNVLDRGAFILGGEVQELEAQLSQYTGAKHVITCANGTDAILIPLMAKNIGKSDAVFVPAFTFFATAEVVSLAGATPIFVDIDPISYNMCAASLEAQIEATKKNSPELNLKAVIVVDLFGLAADYDSLSAVAQKHGLFLIEDAAQGFGSQYRGKTAGNLAPIASTSFFPAKPLGCFGDGGAIFCDDDALAEKIKSIRVHGQGKHKYENVRIGLNSRLDTMQAAILLEKLAIFDDELDRRNIIADRYTNAFTGLIQTPIIPELYYSSWAQYTLRTNRRDEMIEALKTKHIPTMVYYPIPLHLQKAYEYLGYKSGSLPNAEKAAKEVISLPMHPYLTEQDQDLVIDAVTFFLTDESQPASLMVQKALL
jgi:UDP-2-acetamido-2-deoxy-ribo-hexuluronate aminotransferase